MREQKLITSTAQQQLKDEFKKIRNAIPPDKVSLLLFYEFVAGKNPDYESTAGFDRVRKTYYGYTADYWLLELLKEYSSKTTEPCSEENYN